MSLCEGLGPSETLILLSPLHIRTSCNTPGSRSVARPYNRINQSMPGEDHAGPRVLPVVLSCHKCTVTILRFLIYRNCERLPLVTERRFSVLQLSDKTGSSVWRIRHSAALTTSAVNFVYIEDRGPFKVSRRALRFRNTRYPTKLFSTLVTAGNRIVLRS